jgi:hypothetical protein
VLSEQVRQRSFSVPILRRSRIRNARECSCRRRDKIGRQYRLPDHENPYILAIDFSQQFSRCRGPLQANSSRGRQHYNDSDGGCGIVECSLQRREIARRNPNEWRLPLGCRVPDVKVVQGPKRYQKDHNENDSLSTHDLPAKRSASRLAITCGKKMNTNTTNAENHKRNVLIQLGLQLHCFARQDL